jgi:prepilin-type N-terminal cleavage/methylation domain-containing protein
MPRSHHAARHLAFTLIEVMVVVLILGVLALIVIPRVLNAGRRAKETQLRGDLKHLRDSIERFQARTDGLPPRLEDIVAPNGDAISADQDANGVALDRAGYDGPYLVGHQLPKDPFTGDREWDYDTQTGAVHSHSTLLATDRTAYNTW